MALGWVPDGAGDGSAGPGFSGVHEIFDFAPCSPVEKIGFLAKSLSCVTSVGVQVRIGNTATGEYVPGTSDPLSPEGKYVHTVNAPLFGDPRLAFDQSAIGKATLKATRGLGHMTVDTCGKPDLPTLHIAFKAQRMSAEVPRSSKESWCPNMAIRLG